MKPLLFVIMLFCHIVDDFYFQPGMLSKLKQKSWWEENANDKKYKNDYLIALYIHGFSWSFMVHLPLLVYALLGNVNLDVFNTFYPISLGMHTFVHAAIDDQKANYKTTNLITDQIIHFFQMIVIFGMFLGIS